MTVSQDERFNPHLLGALMRYGALAILSLGLVLSANPVFADEYSTSAGNQQMQMQNSAEQNRIAGQAFLEKNKSQPGVVTLPDGLQYKVITEGTGSKPSDNDIVTVNYSGHFIDGGVFDSSYKRGEPATFPVNGVIPGWTEALKLMKAGSTWTLYIPAALAYGEQGAPPAIGPNQTLVFKVELLAVKKPNDQ